MPVLKQNQVLSNDITLTAGGGPTTSSTGTTTTGWHKMVHIKLTNGASAPTTAASASLQASPDNSNWYSFKTFAGPTTSNGETSYTELVWSAVQYVRVVWTHGTGGNDVTARAEVAEATEMSDFTMSPESSTNRGFISHNNITLSNTTETTLVSAGGSGIFNDLTLLTLSNTSSTAVRVDIRDETGGTVRLSMFLAADGGGAVIPFNPFFEQTAANENWTAQLSASVTDVRIMAIAIQNVQS